MITEKIKEVFEFIRFLNLNTNKFKNYVPIVDECLSIGKQMYLLKPENSFEDNAKYKELETIRDSKIKIVYSNVVNVISDKAIDLNICVRTKNGIDLNWGFEEIKEFHKLATEVDFPIINEHEQLYLEFRKGTKSWFLSFHLFFNDLDRYLKNLFGYFDKKAFIEFDELENSAFPKTKINNTNNFNLDKWKFGADFYLMSDEDFKETIFKRYSTQYTNEQLTQVIEKFKRENTQAKKQEAQDIISTKAYLKGKALYTLEGFKKSMSDNSSTTHYIKLQNLWDDSRNKYVIENKLQEVSNGLELLFSTYLSQIFSIYRHAFKYHVNNTLKDVGQLLKKRRDLDRLMLEKTDNIVANIESEIIKGNGQLALRRKKYVLGLFNNLELFLSNVSVNFKESPFLDIFTTSKEKIQNISFEEIKFLNNSTEEPTSKKEHNDYKWVEVIPQPFENLTDKQKKNRIALELIGENDFKTTSIVFHHIEDVLQKYSINNIEAKDILLAMRGSFSGESNERVIPKIVDYLKEIDLKPRVLTEFVPNEVTGLESKIRKHFNFFQNNCPRKHKQIINDDDFDKLISWVLYYYNNDFKIPEISNPINIVNTNKGYVRLAFRYLFKELHKEKTYPKSLFEFYQSAFAPYELDKRKHFEAEKNNDEVKKLMEINY